MDRLPAELKLKLLQSTTTSESCPATIGKSLYALARTNFAFYSVFKQNRRALLESLIHDGTFFGLTPKFNFVVARIHAAHARATEAIAWNTEGCKERDIVENQRFWEEVLGIVQIGPDTKSLTESELVETIAIHKKVRTIVRYEDAMLNERRRWQRANDEEVQGKLFTDDFPQDIWGKISRFYRESLLYIHMMTFDHHGKVRRTANECINDLMDLWNSEAVMDWRSVEYRYFYARIMRLAYPFDWRKSPEARLQIYNALKLEVTGPCSHWVPTNLFTGRAGVNSLFSIMFESSGEVRWTKSGLVLFEVSNWDWKMQEIQYVDDYAEDLGCPNTSTYDARKTEILISLLRERDVSHDTRKRNTCLKYRRLRYLDKKYST